MQFSKISTFFICILALSRVLSVESEINGFSKKGLDEVELWLRVMAAEKKIAGAVFGIMQGGDVVRIAAVGKRDIERNLPMEVDSLFQIRSMSKPITVVAALQQIEENKLSLQAN